MFKKVIVVIGKCEYKINVVFVDDELLFFN